MCVFIRGGGLCLYLWFFVCVCRFLNGFFSHVKQSESKSFCQWVDVRMLAFTPSLARQLFSLWLLFSGKGWRWGWDHCLKTWPDSRTSTTFPLPRSGLYTEQTDVLVCINTMFMTLLWDNYVVLHLSHVPAEPEGKKLNQYVAAYISLLCCHWSIKPSQVFL